MNKHSPPIRAEEALAPDYGTDGYGWALAQARLLREQRADAIDWDNVAEEIEDMGKQVRQTAESNLRVALVHILKWGHQPVFRGRSWTNSIREHLRRFDRVLSRNPSLKPELSEILADAYSDARFDAAQETGLEVSVFPDTPPSWEEIRGPLPD